MFELIEKGKTITAKHNGYKKFGVIHTRTFNVLDSQIKIIDKLSSKKNKNKCNAYIHFHPDVKFVIDGSFIDSQKFSIDFSNVESIKEKKYTFAQSFNNTIEARYLEIKFNKELSTIIKIK